MDDVNASLEIDFDSRSGLDNRKYTYRYNLRKNGHSKLKKEENDIAA